MEVRSNAFHTEFCFSVPWAAFLGRALDAQSVDPILRFLNLLIDLTYFAPGNAVMRACRAGRLDLFLRFYPFVGDDRGDQHACPTERNGFLWIALMESRQEARYRLIVKLEDAKALLILGHLSQSAIPHWPVLGFDVLSRRLIRSLGGNPQRAMGTLASCVIIKHFSTLGFACFSGCAFGVTSLLYARASTATPQLKQHAAYGVLVDVDLTVVDSDGQHQSHHRHSSWMDAVRAVRCLNIWRKRMRWVHVEVWCVSTKANAQPVRPSLSDKILSIATLHENFDVYGVVTRDVVCSRLVM